MLASVEVLITLAALISNVFFDTHLGPINLLFPAHTVQIILDFLHLELIGVSKFAVKPSYRASQSSLVLHTLNTDLVFIFPLTVRRPCSEMAAESLQGCIEK